MDNDYTSIASVEGRFLLNQIIHWSMVGLIFPVLSLAMLEKGVDLFQLGLLMAGYSGAAVLLELPTGGLADSLGRKTVYSISLVFMITGGMVFYFADGFPSILTAFMFMGTGRALSSGSIDAHFIDSLYRLNPDIQLQRTMARIHAAVPVALGLASLAAGFLPDLSRALPESPLLRDAYSLNVLAYVGMGLVQLLVTGLLVRDNSGKRGFTGILDGFRSVPEVVTSSIRHGLGNRTILLIMIGGFVWGFAIAGLEQLWQPRAAEIGGTGIASAIFGVLAFGYFAAAAVGSLLSTPLSRLFRGNNRLLLSMVRLLMGLSFFILAGRAALAGFSLFYFSTFLFNGMANAPEAEVMNRAIPAERRSTVLSFASLVMQTGGLLGSMLLGFAARELSIPFAWTLASVILMASALLYLMLPREG